MNYHTRKSGNSAENYSAHYLLACGYEILVSNWYAGHREIDLIARDEERTIFIEVKSGREHSDPTIHFTKTKQRDLGLAMTAYLDQKDLWSSHFQADLLSITITRQGEIATLEHYTDVI